MRAALGVGLLVVAALVLPSTTSATSSVGDADCSGQVSSIDAALVLQHNAGLIPTLPCQAKADPNMDGHINSVDATLILQFVAGLLDQLPPPATPLVIHHIDVEQGDATLLVAPNGQTAMIDDGRWTTCDNVVSYVEAQGIDHIDYNFATHYDADHIGCLDDLVEAGVTVGACYDRGTAHEPTTATYGDYVAACGNRRHSAIAGQTVSLGLATINVVVLNGVGVSTTDENALSLVLRVSFGSFDEVIAGDLPGASPDIEAVAGPLVGHVEVYHVNHHGSRFSSTDDWLDDILPEVGIISVGNNSYGHPTADALGRLHSHGVHTYWTNTGSGVAPDLAWDRVGGTIVIDVGAGSTTYTVSGSGFSDVYHDD